MNMALDEVFWQSALAPCLRFYQWDHPALSFGYFGRYADVAEYKSERELVRRCTGGGVVFHGSDLTYALIIPANNHCPESSSMAIYARVHEAIQTGLRDVGIEARLVPTNGVALSATSTGPCFANPVAWDVLVNGRKVAGAAQRRSRRGLLQQGSVQNVRLSGKFRERFIAQLCENPIVAAIDSDLLKQAQRLTDTKYGSEAWLYRR